MNWIKAAKSVEPAVPKTDLPKKSSFSVIFTSSLGAASIGSAFGVPGFLLGAVFGFGIGALINRTHA